MAIHQDSIFNELRLRMKLMEQHSEHTGKRMEEKLLLWLVSDTINQADDVDELIYNLLERISMIREIPFSACCKVSGDQLSSLSYYFNQEDVYFRKCPFKVSPALLTKLKSGPLFIKKELFDLEGLSIKDKFDFTPDSVAIFPFESLCVPFGIFVFFEEGFFENGLSGYNIVIRQIINMAIEKLDKLTLLEELKNLNVNFENKLRERTKELKESKKSLKREIKELKEKKNGKPLPDIGEKFQPGIEKELPVDIESSMLVNISHEIRTPLNSILGFAEILRNPEVKPEEKEKYINIIKTCGKSIVKIIDDVIDLSKIENDQVHINKEDFPIAKFMTELYDHFKNDELFRQKENIELRLNINIDGNTIIHSDRDRVWQILINLICNALKYTEEGFVEIGCRIKNNSANNKGNKDLTFFVRDTGIGIEDELQSAIFDKFVKIEHDVTVLYGGTGLGLTIARELAKLMGGDIWFKSKPGEGSEFYFTLPDSVVVLNGNDKPLTTKELKSKYNWDGKRVMIVEDDEMSFIYLKEVLKSTNIEIIHAWNGIEAVELASADQNIDLILMDIKLPEMDGYEATRQIKQFNESVPVIAQTAYAMADDEQKSKQVGCDDYISKPINRRKLLQTMDVLIH